MRFQCVFAILAVFPVIGDSEQPYGEHFYEAEVGFQPDHLTPVNPYVPSWHREYQERVEEHLFQTEADIAQCLKMPSFSGESCISIRSEVSKDLLRQYEFKCLVPYKKRRFFITATRATESLWYTMARNNDEKKTKPVKVARVEREISVELAGAIQWAWGRMLHHTRYPARVIDGRDGVTYRFSAEVGGLGNICGQTWSPREGLTAEMVNLADELSAFASGQESSEGPLLKKFGDFEAKVPAIKLPPLPKEPDEGVVDPFADPANQKRQNKRSHRTLDDRG